MTPGRSFIQRVNGPNRTPGRVWGPQGPSPWGDRGYHPLEGAQEKAPSQIPERQGHSQGMQGVLMKSQVFGTVRLSEETLSLTLELQWGGQGDLGPGGWVLPNPRQAEEDG